MTANGSNDPESDNCGSPNDRCIDDEIKVPAPVRERILDVLEERDGAIWQYELMAETGWSRPFVSLMTMRMAKAGDLVRFGVDENCRLYAPDNLPERIERLLSDATLQRIYGGGVL